VLKEQLFNGLSIDAMVGEIREAHDGQEKKNADKPKN
jgi:hypothetical protein